MVCGWTRPEPGNHFLFFDEKLIIFLLNSLLKVAQNLIWWTSADLEEFEVILRGVFGSCDYIYIYIYTHIIATGMRTEQLKATHEL